MNIHVALVHFPIALLSLYSILEFVRIRKITNQPYWFFIKAALVISGTVSSYATYLAGDAIEDSFRSVRNIVEMHSLWAGITLFIFTMLAATYTVAWIERETRQNSKFITSLGSLWNIAIRIEHAVLETKLVLLLALAGLAAVTITGALGGAIAFGPDTDPLVRIVYDIFIGK